MTVEVVSEVRAFDGVQGVYRHQARETDCAMRFAVSPDGRKVITNQALDASQASWSGPTGGTVAGDRFVFIADSQRGLLDAYGNVRDPDQLAPVELWSSDARLAWNVQVDDDALAGSKKPAE